MFVEEFSYLGKECGHFGYSHMYSFWAGYEAVKKRDSSVSTRWSHLMMMMVLQFIWSKSFHMLSNLLKGALALQCLYITLCVNMSGFRSALIMLLFFFLSNISREQCHTTGTATDLQMCYIKHRVSWNQRRAKVQLCRAASCCSRRVAVESRWGSFSRAHHTAHLLAEEEKGKRVSWTLCDREEEKTVPGRQGQRPEYQEAGSGDRRLSGCRGGGAFSAQGTSVLKHPRLCLRRRAPSLRSHGLFHRWEGREEREAGAGSRWQRGGS